MSDLMELALKFIQLNMDMTKGYVNLYDVVETYTALDLLTEREFQPILKKLNQSGVDLFLVLAVCFGLLIRIPEDDFRSLQGKLRLEENRIVLRSKGRTVDLAKYQKVADRSAMRYLESVLIICENFHQHPEAQHLN
ncbi:MAG: hypothetical protein H0Z38_03725 [Firmicutes bacterium]|nr:hypothetical protein [Bacillota bacterium]